LAKQKMKIVICGKIKNQIIKCNNIPPQQLVVDISDNEQHHLSFPLLLIFGNDGRILRMVPSPGTNAICGSNTKTY
tara:strand:+ start:449 stop:676 length:228 start_codon:yes stop_codon:yes gene_type:complete